MVRRVSISKIIEYMAKFLSWGFDSSAARQSFKVSWMSGLNRHPAKVLSVEIWAVGSNPTLSAKLKGNYV